MLRLQVGETHIWLGFYLQEQAGQVFKVHCFSQTFIKPIMANISMQMSLFIFQE